MITEKIHSPGIAPRSGFIVERGAIFSDDRRCRFRLWRVWSNVGRKLVFIMLNPSIAGAYMDDPTVKKCMRYARRWGFSRLDVVNVYPHISTDPKKLDRRLNRAQNLAVIEAYVEYSDRVVCAWGKHAHAEDVKRVLLAMAPRLDVRRDIVALRRNKDGSPQHPLYIPDNVEPVVYP